MSEGSSKHHPAHPENDPPKRGSRVHWGPVSAILYTAFLYLGAQFFAGLTIAILSAMTGLSFGGSQGIAGQFYFVLISDAILILALWLFLRPHGGNFRPLGFSRKPAARDVSYALVGYLVYFGLLLLALAVVGPLTGINLEQQQELGFNNLLTHAEKIMGLIALVLLPPIVEETVFRGFLFTGLRKKMKFIWAALVTSLLFATPHLFASSEGLLWVAGIDTFLLSLVLCYLREKTGALWAPMAVHAIKNAIAYTILLTSVGML